MNKFISKYLQFPLAFTLSFGYLVNSPALAMENIIIGENDTNNKNDISLNETESNQNNSCEENLARNKILDKLNGNLYSLNNHSARGDDEYSISIIDQESGSKWKKICKDLCIYYTEMLEKLNNPKNHIDLNTLRDLEKTTKEILKTVSLTHWAAVDIISPFTNSYKVDTPQEKNEKLKSNLQRIIIRDGLPLLPDMNPTEYLQNYQKSASQYQWETMDLTESIEVLKSLFLAYVLPVSIRSLKYHLKPLP